MQVGYYPGCSLESTARDYAESVEGVAQLMEIELCPVEDWNCCGASAAHSLDHRLSLNLGARNLALAARGPQPVVVPCPLCFNRLKTAQAELARDSEPVHPEVAALGRDWAQAQVVELGEFLTTPEMRRRIGRAARFDLEGLEPVCYYGCQGQRPPWITGNPDYESPAGMDRLLAELGAGVRDWPGKTECCGASHAVAQPELVDELVARLYRQALEAGANCIVTGCQMCQANLDLYQQRIGARLEGPVYLPVFYFTELLGLALGHPRAASWLSRHMVDPRALLARTKLPPQSWERV